jgi:tetratricopeptide (TPR) repeat protein
MNVGSTVNFIDPFAVMSQQPAQLESIANRALASGTDLYMQGQYEAAIKAFQRAIGLSPQSPYATDAAHFMANAYLQLENVEGALRAYRDAIRLNPYSDSSHLKMGHLYFAEERYPEAVDAYEQAVRLNPSALNRYALGQGYLQAGRMRDAETQFREVKRLEPRQVNGDFGIGLVYSQEGRYAEAIRQFEATLELQRDFYDAHAEIGYAYADMGDIEAATQQLDELTGKAPELADTLSRYIYKVEAPQIAFAVAEGSFPYSLPPKTPVAALDDYLANAGATKNFTVIFQFTKQMDRAQVENRFNWQIGRATAGGPGQAYNYGLGIPATEIALSPIPLTVLYNDQTFQATVTFAVTQNATADGTIDPSHIEFAFNGRDQFGITIDGDHDQFNGFRGVY